MAKTHRKSAGMRNPNTRELSARVVRRDTIGFEELSRAFLGIAAARAEAATHNDTRRTIGPGEKEGSDEANA